MNCRYLLIFFVSLSVVLPITATAQTSFYMNGLQYKQNSYASKIEVLPERGMELRHTLIQPTPITNLDSFWRGSFEGSYEFTHYSSVDGTIHTGSIGLTLGGGLSYRLLSRSHWGLAPFFSVFFDNRWKFNRDHLDYWRFWRIETGFAMDMPGKMELLWMYTDKAFLLGFNYKL